MNFKKTVLKIFIVASILALPFTAKADIYKDNNIPNKIRSRIEKIVDSPSSLAGIDNFKRKPREERIKDNIDWYKTYGKVNRNYNNYCLDIENFGNQYDFLNRNLGFDHQEKSDPSQREFLTADKLSLYSLVNKKYKKLNRPVYFRFQGEKLLDFEYSKIKNCSKTRSALKKLHNGKYFIKPQSSSLGENAILLVKNGKNLKFTHVTKGEINLKQFLKITNTKPFFIQDYVKQHKDLKALNPSSLNTIRIVTTKFNDKPHILCAALRMGKNSKSIVDNASKGGCFVEIDEKTGKLKKYAFFFKGRVVKEHPESKIKFENYQVPFWNECIEAAKKLQMMSKGYSSIGWDIAITPDGPILIEGNGKWSETIPNLVCRGIRKKWEKLKNM